MYPKEGEERGKEGCKKKAETRRREGKTGGRKRKKMGWDDV